ARSVRVQTGGGCRDRRLCRNRLRISLAGEAARREERHVVRTHAAGALRMASAVLKPLATAKTFDLSQSAVRALNQWLHTDLAGSGVSHVEVLNPDGAHSIAVGLDAPVTVDVRG